MRKGKIFLLVLGGVFLSGCTMQTPEAGKKPAPTGQLTFYSYQAASEGKHKQETAPPEPQAAPPVADNTLTDNKMYATPPQMTIDANKQYIATFKTSQGDIVVALAAKETPITVNNFVFLAKEKFYDGTIFHRVIKGFMIQGGDPEGTGMGGPGYAFADEPFTGEYTRGTLAMANAGPNTNGSQFFIMHKDNPLPPNYVIFGHVVSGLEVVDKIAEAPTKLGGEGSAPVAPVMVQIIEIAEK
jgi:cyclophilin family peptidyl-prolyl cis-trans isomerase